MTTCHFRNCPGRPSGSTIRPDGIELLYCVAHEAIARNLPPLRSAGCCASEGCGRPRGQRSPLCRSCRPRYAAWGLDGHLPAQEAPMTEPTITPPTEPKESAGVGAPHPLETRRDALVERLLAAGFDEGRRPVENLRRFHHDPKVIVLIPDGHPCEVEGDFATLLDKAEEQCAKVERATAPPATVEEFLRDLESGDGEPSMGDVADAPLFVGGTDTAPAELVARWGYKQDVPLDGLAALAARGQQPTAPGSTVAELQAELAQERERADAAQTQLREALADLATIAVMLNLEDAPAFDAEDQPIPLPTRVQAALMPDPAYERELRKSLHAVEAELFEVDRTLQHLGAYGTGPAKERLLQVLTPEDRRNILELQAAEARMDLARLKARRLNPAPPEKLAEYAAKVAALNARIAALDHIPDAGKMVQG